ncbi:putative ribonuclease H-like domain-containing protein [Tanacetum coccineum]
MLVACFLSQEEPKEVYVKQPPGFEDPAHPNKVYIVVKALYGLQSSPQEQGFEDHYAQGLQVKQSNGGIFLSQDKYVKDILNKFDFRTIKPASTPIEAHKSLGKDEEGEDVDVHLYSHSKFSHLLQSKGSSGISNINLSWFMVSKTLHFIWKLFRIVDYAGHNQMTEDHLHGWDVQYLGRRLVSSNARNKQLWLSPLQKQNM